jgi:glutathione-regulated potassium-efflux system ancillary protein KefC
LKGDLGALVLGMLVAPNHKATEMGEKLLSFKNLFLTAFFLNIGLSGLPTFVGLGIALILAFAMPLKVVLFFILLTAFRLPTRHAMLTSMGLANYSEFGLIVGSVCASQGWLDAQWLVILAIALSLTFVAAAPANAFSSAIYTRWVGSLVRTQRVALEMEPIEIRTAHIVIIGMGGIVTAAYDELLRNYREVPVGVDFCSDVVEDHRKHGRNVVEGDADDSSFWDRIGLSHRNVDLVMLALPDLKTSVFAVSQMREKGYLGRIIASMQYQDEIDRLRKAGVDAGYAIYKEAGIGFANYASQYLDISLFRNPDMS